MEDLDVMDVWKTRGGKWVLRIVRSNSTFTVESLRNGKSQARSTGHRTVEEAERELILQVRNAELYDNIRYKRKK
jgi:hypothetical protein